MKHRYRLLVWIALADFFTVFSVATFGVYAAQRNRMLKAEAVIRVDRQVSNLAKQLAERLQAHGIAVDKPDENMAIQLPAVLLFESGDWIIKSPSAIDKIVAALKDVQKEWRGNFVLVIRGHTDSVPPKRTAKYHDNLELSRWRAEAMAISLAKTGISPPSFQVVAEGVGEFEPVIPNCRSGVRVKCLSKSDFLENDELSKNRRIELRFGVFSGNVSNFREKAEKHEVHP